LARSGVRGTFSQPGPSHPAASGRLTRTLGRMKPTLSNLDDPELGQLGVGASRLLCSGQLLALHEQFGYALAFDRDPIVALENDVAAVLAEVGASGFGDADHITYRVSHFEPSEEGLISLVECLVPTSNRREVLVELVLSTNGSERYLTLEQVSSAT
jgi:hypothetical protein